MRLRADDPYVQRLADDMESLIAGNANLRASVLDRLYDLAERQSDAVASHFRATGRGFGVPTSAYRGKGLFHFPEAEAVRTFRTSGTSGRTRGIKAYSARGLSLLSAAILQQARQQLAPGTKGPQFACIRLIPASEVVPDVIMAYGMELIAGELGLPTVSDTAFCGLELASARLQDLLGEAIATQAPVLLMGGTFGVVNVCDALAALGKRFELPAGSIVLDAGGLKNRARSISVPAYVRLVADCFGPVRCLNLFGMTELASQLYDVSPDAVGPRGERAKGGCNWAWPTVRDPYTLSTKSEGIGLLEITDLAVLDHPCVVLSDDIALATMRGPAIIGRATGSPTRGCALHIEELAGGDA